MSVGVLNGGVAVPRISDLLRTPDDLEKISMFKSDVLRTKADVDVRLKEGLREHLDTTQSGMSTLAEGQKLVGQIRDEMKSIHDLCEQAQAIRKDFPQIDFLARVHRNFEATRAMQAGLISFNDACNEVKRLLEDDEQDLDNQPNLLEAHMKLTKLRDFRDEALDQIKRARDGSLEQTLLDWFQELDVVIEQFDEHIGDIAMRLINLTQRENDGLIVRFAIVIAAEEKNDNRVRAIQDAQKDHQDLVSKFTSFIIGPKIIRGYKEKFLACIKSFASQQFDRIHDAFRDEPDKLEKHTKWFFNDLFACRQGMQKLFPKKWKIFKIYADIYHNEMHDFLLGHVNSDDLRPPEMLAIVHFIDVYYKKMSKLGIPQSELSPHIIDSKEADLVRDYRNIITTALTSWIDRMFVTDRKDFLAHSVEALDQDTNGHYRTKTLGDLWRMLHEQTVAAGESDREDVVEGVMTAMFQALKSRQQQWERLIDEEVAKYKNPSPELTESINGFQDWLLAIANDSIACIDDASGANNFSSQVGYLSRFQEDFAKLQTPPSAKFMSSIATNEIDSLRNGYVDLATFCINRFVSLIFIADFRTVVADLFIPTKWYTENTMKQITLTFADYANDGANFLSQLLLDILIEEMSDALLVNYLTAIKTNKGAKFKRQDRFGDKFRDDVLTAFEFFQKYPEAFNETIKPKWKVIHLAVELLSTEKNSVVSVYSQFKREFWDLQLSWVEGVLKSRDDWDRGMITAVKRAAANAQAERGMETIMGKVK